MLGCRPRRMEPLGVRHFAVEFGNEIRADFQCLTGASLCELGEEFAALRIACPDESNRLTLDVGEFFGPALLYRVERLAHLGLPVVEHPGSRVSFDVVEEFLELPPVGLRVVGSRCYVLGPLGYDGRCGKSQGIRHAGGCWEDREVDARAWCGGRPPQVWQLVERRA